MLACLNMRTKELANFSHKIDSETNNLNYDNYKKFFIGCFSFFVTFTNLVYLLGISFYYHVTLCFE